MRSPFWRPRLEKVRLERLDDPEEWRKIPILDKDTLRALTDEQFYREFCVARRRRHLRSTGAPAASPASRSSIRAATATWSTALKLSRAPIDCAGAGPAIARTSRFRSASIRSGRCLRAAPPSRGITVNWAGSGTSTPSALQIELIQRLKPTLWLGMSSYALHLANLAEARGVDLRRSVKTSSDLRRAGVAGKARQDRAHLGREGAPTPSA